MRKFSSYLHELVWVGFFGLCHVLFFTSLWVIILYLKSILNAYSLLSHKLWVPLIKFMIGPTTSVRGESTHLMYSQSI